MGGNLSQEQRETLALIDSILSMMEKAPKNEINFGIVANPFDFLISIISKLVTFEDMMKWLSRVLVEILPSIELAIKAVLIAKLKERIDCNIDPRIPDWIRKDIDERLDKTDINKKGLMFNLQDIDFNNMMSISPLSTWGRNIYFGTKKYYIIGEDSEETYDTFDAAVAACKDKKAKISSIIDKSEINNVYELARAKDFNAFLWFVVNKGYFPTIKKIDEINNLKEYYHEFDYNSPDNAKVFPGETVGDADSTVLSLCLKNESNDNIDYTVKKQDAFIANNPNEIINYHNAPRRFKSFLVPFSSNNFSANWYVNNGTYFNFLKKPENRTPRDYSKEYAICNLMYMDKVEGMDENGRGYRYDNGIRFTILPKPFVHVPMQEEPAWRFKRFLFDSDGNPDKKGKYSAKIINTKPTYDGKTYTYQCGYGANIKLDADTGEYTLNCQQENLSKVLYECYPGLTVYEFNYDFVMGMQLFDPVVVAHNLISMITNIKFGGVGINFKISKSETAYQMRIAEVVKNIVESTAFEVSDCFYTFDNDKYDAMIRESELKRSNLYPFNKNGKADIDNNSDSDDAFEILNKFNENATLNENIETVNRAFTKATASITEEVLPEDKYNIQKNIITDIIKNLVNVIVETLITPKLVLLFEVNMALLGNREGKDGWFKNIDDFLRAIGGLLVAIVKEIRDLILQQILDWAMSILLELLNVLKDLLIKEQLEYYSRLMKLLFKACSFKVKHRKPLESELDYVDYADIDEVDRPQEASC